MTCIITGCAAVNEVEGVWCWGDLFQIGGAYILHATTKKIDSKDAILWHNIEDLGERRALLLDDRAQWWERRGVIVVSSFGTRGAQLNQAARAYLNLP